jgi:hypothetical protein
VVLEKIEDIANPKYLNLTFSIKVVDGISIFDMKARQNIDSRRKLTVSGVNINSRLTSLTKRFSSRVNLGFSSRKMMGIMKISYSIRQWVCANSSNRFRKI